MNRDNYNVNDHADDNDAPGACAPECVACSHTEAEHLHTGECSVCQCKGYADEMTHAIALDIIAEAARDWANDLPEQAEGGTETDHVEKNAAARRIYAALTANRGPRTNPYRQGDRVYWLRTDGGGGGSGRRACTKTAEPAVVLLVNERTCDIALGEENGRHTRVRFGALALRYDTPRPHFSADPHEPDER